MGIGIVVACPSLQTPSQSGDEAGESGNAGGGGDSGLEELLAATRKPPKRSRRPLRRQRSLLPKELQTERQQAGRAGLSLRVYQSSCCPRSCGPAAKR